MSETPNDYWAFWALTALADGRSHRGYAVLQRIRDLSGRAVMIRTGVLYPLLDRLVKEGRVRRYTSDGTTVYEITDEGARMLSEGIARRRFEADTAESVTAPAPEYTTCYEGIITIRYPLGSDAPNELRRG